MTGEIWKGPWWQEWRVMCLIAVVALPLFTPRVYASDEIKYFATLRSVYFDRDLHYENEYAHFIDRDPVAHAGLRPLRDTLTPTGYRLNDAPIGAAVLWAPFYVIADAAVVVARFSGVPVQRDGYGQPYIWAVCLGSLFWGTAGLFLVFRLCRSYTRRWDSTVGVCAVWFASPVVFYLYITPAMAHANSLFTVALFLIVWQGGRDFRTVRGWFGLGMVAGLMILVRELNWLFLIVVAVDEGLIIIQMLRAEGKAVAIGQLRRRYKGYASFSLAFVLVVVPQFYVYHTLNGTFGPTPFIVEKFSLVPRHALDVLVSGFHGLFSWHPVTLLGVLGLGVLWQRDARLAAALALCFVAQVLVIGSYDTWAGGASFGARRFINCTPIFAVGLAAMFANCRAHIQRVAAVGMVCLIFWNAGLAIQYSTGLIPRDAPVTMRRIVRNQVFEVPPQIMGIAWRFIFDRSSFYRTRS